jgi:hypothetical protein
MVRHEKPRVQIPPETHRKNTIKVPGIHFPPRSANPFSRDTQQVNHLLLSGYRVGNANGMIVLADTHRVSSRFEYNASREPPHSQKAADSFQPIHCASTQRQLREDLGINALNGFPESLPISTVGAALRRDCIVNGQPAKSLILHQ